jgi:hypothetical protein
MSIAGQNLKNIINLRVRNYPLESFQNMWMNTILNLLVDLADTGGSGGSSESALKVVSANFTTATDCPLSALNGENLAIYWNDANKFLDSATDFTPYVGGGFTILIPGFNSTTANYTFYVFIQSN